jgi:hypothetical protein
MAYTCETCRQKIKDFPLKRPGYPFAYWCTVECLIEYQQRIDEKHQENLKRL